MTTLYDQELDEVEGLDVTRPKYDSMTQALAVLSADMEKIVKTRRSDADLEEVLAELNVSPEHRALLRTRDLNLIQAEVQKEARETTGNVIIAWALVRVGD